MNILLKSMVEEASSIRRKRRKCRKSRKLTLDQTKKAFFRKNLIYSVKRETHKIVHNSTKLATFRCFYLFELALKLRTKTMERRNFLNL